MTTFLLAFMFIKLAGISAWWATPIIAVAFMYEAARLSVLLDIQRKATEAALKADEARTFALGAALESRRLADAFAPASAVDLAVTPEVPEPLPEIEPVPVLKTSPDLVVKPERPHNL